MSTNESNRPVASSRAKSSVNGWLVGVLVALSGLLVYQMVTGGLSPLHDRDADSRPITPRGELAADEKSTIDLFRQASPSVVHINTYQVGRDPANLNLHEIPQGAGSGFLWDENGYVVTNYHVILNAQGARVTLADHSVWDARRVGFEPDKDVAVLKIDAPKSRLRAILIGESGDLQVGQKVFAIGNPFGLDQTLTTGVISGLGRTIMSVNRTPIQGVIQTDTAINPGNSGGPLLDSAGRLIGMNTAILSPSGAYAGIGFAVPVDTVNLIVPQLIRYGAVDRAGLGIALAPDAWVEQLVQNGVLSERGVLVLNVIEKSGAAEAGILPIRQSDTGQWFLGDLVIAIDGQAVRNSAELLKAIDGRKVGNTVAVTIWRDEQKLNVDITLRTLPTVSF